MIGLSTSVAGLGNVDNVILSVVELVSVTVNSVELGVHASCNVCVLGDTVLY